MENRPTPTNAGRGSIRTSRGGLGVELGCHDISSEPESGSSLKFSFQSLPVMVNESSMKSNTSALYPIGTLGLR